jgi:hypothetical protein
MFNSAGYSVNNVPQVTLHGGRGNTETLFEKKTTSFYLETMKFVYSR